MSSPRFIILFFAFLCVSIAFVYARDIVITVEDEELGMPLEGATVSLRDGRQFACDKNGEAKVNLSDNRQTIVQITYPGYDTKRMNVPASSDGTKVERFTVSLRLGGVMEARELVVEAQRPQTSETKSGRSVAISERELERTAEIGIIEDVMSSVKLLPGVGYTGMFGAFPSIRGGDPGDMTASLDGFYLERPFHWAGAVSIFDPKMVSSARLSHGVFSARYGHTISGLLEVTSKSPSTTDIEMETAIGSSAASLSLSYPLNGKGGVLFMGKVTYWDTLVWAAKGLSQVIEDENLALINSVSTSPYIRSAALSANYRFTPDLDWRLNLFFGSDGVGAAYNDERSGEDGVSRKLDMKADYDNYQGFLISGLTMSPSPVVAVKVTGGAGFIKTITNDVAYNENVSKYNKGFLEDYPFLKEDPFNLEEGGIYKVPGVDMKVELEHTIFNAQARADVDWDLGKGFITAFGVHELYSSWEQNQYIDLALEIPLGYVSQLPWFSAMFPNINPDDLAKMRLLRPTGYNSELSNHGFFTSGYGLLEYSSPNNRFGAELGLRLDHLYFLGKDFSVYTPPAFSPRLNVDFNIFKNRGIIDSLDITAGTGLFSSMNSLVSFINGSGGMDGSDLRFNRSWTTVIGVKTDIARDYSFNIEGYYKYVFDRAYITADTAADSIDPSFLFDGIGHVAGFDIQLQKLESRYWDGWISYTFTWARYLDPSGGEQGVSQGSVDTVDNKWYYPSFHRFHNANIVLNIKPSQKINISTRFGFASGQPKDKVVDGKIYSYPVLAMDKNGNVIRDENGKPVIMQKYRRDSEYDDNERSSWSLPWDLKVSFFLFDRKGRVNTEIYVAAENLTSLFYQPASSDTTFNSYTGEEEPARAGSGTTGFDLPIPMISFGFKWRY